MVKKISALCLILAVMVSVFAFSSAAIDSLVSAADEGVKFYDASQNLRIGAFENLESIYAKVKFPKNDASEMKLVVAKYDEYGVLLSATSSVLQKGATECTTENIATEGLKTVKIFVWETSLKPAILPGVIEKTGVKEVKVIKNDITLETGKSYKLGELFAEKENLANAVDSESFKLETTADVTYVPDSTNWAEGTIVANEAGVISIKVYDNVLCTPFEAEFTAKALADKFAVKGTSFSLSYPSMVKAVKLGDIFTAVDGAVIGENVTVTFNGEAVAVNAENWADTEITFNAVGEAVFTITDNDFCKLATATVAVLDAENVDKFTANENVSVALAYPAMEAKLALGDVFAAIDDELIDSANVTVTGCAAAVDVNDWKNTILTFNTAGEVTVAITDENYCNTSTATVKVEAPATEDRFKVQFPNTDEYLYRVGNGSAAPLSSLFALLDGQAVNNGDVTVNVENVNGNVTGVYTANASDWSKGTIKFEGTGVAVITISAAYTNAVSLEVEIVNATNVSKYSELKNQNSVLLNDVVMSSNSAIYLSGAILYGNGFTFDCSNAAYSGSGSVSENYIVGLTNSHLDNVKIIGAVYTEYGAQASNNYNRALVVSKGNSSIENCYLSNTASPVRMVEGNLSVKNTTVKGGNFANIDVRNGNLVVENVTTINQALGNDKAKDGSDVIGLGIAVYYEGVDASLTSVTINGTLTQYNHISTNDDFSNSYANQIVDSMFSSSYADCQFSDGSAKWVNPGILLLTAGLESKLVDNRSDKQNYQAKYTDFLGKSGYAYVQKPTAQSIVQVPAEYITSGQGIIAPVYSFDYTTKNYLPKTDVSNDYCYYDSGKVMISMDAGESFDWNPFILTATKSGKTLDYTVSMNGKTYANGTKINLSETGTYEVVYSYTDNDNYVINTDGEVVSVGVNYEKTLVLSVTVALPTTKHAVFTFADTNTETETININNKTYVSAKGVTATDKEWGYISVNGNKIYYPITEAQMKKSGSEVQVYYYVFKDAVTITDYAGGLEGGAETTYDASTKSMPANLAVVNGFEGKYDSLSSACIDVSRLTKDGPSGEVWDFSASTTVAGTTTYNNYLAHRSPSGLSVKSGTRDYDAITIAQFCYTDNANTPHYYFVGYFMPNQYSSGGGGCVAEDTLITLADGSQKEVRNLATNDMILVWNLKTGTYDTMPIVFNEFEAEADYEIVHLYFSDGSDVEVVYEHGFFDVNLGEYVYITSENAKDYIGHSFVTLGSIEKNIWKTAELTKVDIVTKKVTPYSPVTFEHLCYYTNGVLSMPGGIEGIFNIFEVDTDIMAYDAEKMAKDIEKYGLFEYADFDELIPEYVYQAFNGQYLKVAIGKGNITWEGIAELAERYGRHWEN